MSESSSLPTQFQGQIVSSLPDHDKKDPIQSEPSNKKSTKLILHLDINETILIGDEAGGDSREDCLNKVLAKAAFVQIPEDKSSSENDLLQSYTATQNMEPTHWWDGTPLEPPTTTVVPPLYTGWAWPRNCCPYYRTALKRHGKHFTQSEHHGHCYRALYDYVDQKLAAMEHSVDNMATTTLSDEDTTCLRRVWSHMIPATFVLLESLSKQQEKQDFTVVFRTFGTDLPDIAKAITAFAQGKHPKYPDFHDPNLCLLKLYKGRWALIDDKDSGDNDAATTTTTSSSPIDRYKYQLLDDVTNEVVASGDEEIVQLLEQQTVGAVGIQDDYDFWDDNDYVPWAGKPVWVPAIMKQPGDTEEKEQDQPIASHSFCHHVFFDDNIHHQVDDSIASVRVQEQPKGPYRTLSGLETLEQQGLYLMRVSTIEPLLDDFWFVRQLDEAQDKFARLHQD